MRKRFSIAAQRNARADGFAEDMLAAEDETAARRILYIYLGAALADDTIITHRDPVFVEYAKRFEIKPNFIAIATTLAALDAAKDFSDVKKLWIEHAVQMFHGGDRFGSRSIVYLKFCERVQSIMNESEMLGS